MTIFKKLFFTLSQEDVLYMVAGGIAINLYGIERATADIVIVLRLDKENVSRFVEMPFDFDEIYKQRKRIKFESTVIPVVPIKELIKMKEKSDRPQDRADIFYLKKIVGNWKDEE